MEEGEYDAGRGKKGERGTRKVSWGGMALLGVSSCDPAVWAALEDLEQSRKVLEARLRFCVLSTLCGRLIQLT